MLIPLRRIFSTQSGAGAGPAPAALAPLMARRRLPLVGLLLALVILAAGCGSGGLTQSWGSLTTDDDGLILVYMDRAARLNVTDTGASMRWQFPIEPNPQAQFYASPAVTEDRVYIGGYDRTVYALTRGRGEQEWAFSGTEDHPIEDRIIGGVAAGHGNVYFGVGNHGAFAADAETGEFVWYHATEHGVWSTPLVLDDQVLVTSLDHYLYSLDPDSGEELWKVDLEGAIAGAPVFDGDGTLYVGSFANKLFAVSSNDGEILDTFETQGWVWGSPALVDGELYFGDMAGYIYALAADSFAPLWPMRQAAEQAIRATPLVTEDYVVVGSRDDRVYALNRDTGTQAWAQPLGSDVLVTPVLLSDEEGEPLVVVNTQAADRLLTAFRLDSGAEVWHYPVTTEQ